MPAVLNGEEHGASSRPRNVPIESRQEVLHGSHETARDGAVGARRRVALHRLHGGRRPLTRTTAARCAVSPARAAVTSSPSASDDADHVRHGGAAPRGSRLVPTHLNGPRHIERPVIAIGLFLGELRRTACGCVGVGAAYKSVALPLSYPGVRLWSLALASHSRRVFGRWFQQVVPRGSSDFRA